LKIRAIIVDDEELARDEMKFLLEGEGDVEIVGEAAGGEEAVNLVREHKPDLIFLDIQMPVMDGFQVVQTLLGLDELPLVVFSTAYDQYAIKAFEVNALDYLLKPIEKKRLEQALDRVREAMPKREEFIERVRKMTENIKIGTRFLQRIVLRSGEEVTLIEVQRVAMLHQEGHRVKAHTNEGDFTANYRNLDEIETQLDPTLFVRLGGEYLVNLHRIAKITPWSGGNYVMTLDDAAGTEVRLSKSQAKLLKNKVEGAI
jgi:two-component system LytT family response regulator/two-component system response regulator LytT